MPRVSLLVGLGLMFALAGRAGAAETPPDVRVIVVPKAQVWCGPSTADGLYPTNELLQGNRVQVVEELKSGWLAIRPPAGSFSFINTRFLQHPSAQQTNYVVAHEDYPVPVLVGSELKPGRPTKTGIKLPRGTIVRGIGRTLSDQEGTWLPIEPPPGEVRYIRKEEVKSLTPATATVSASGNVKGTTAPLPSVPPPPPDGDVLWRQAEKAQSTGHLADAIRLYRLAGDANLAVNRARADEAYRRAHWLQQASSPTNPPSGSYYYPERDGRASSSPPVRPAIPCSSTCPPGQLCSMQNPSVQPISTLGMQTSGPGRLRHAGRTVEKQRTYALENTRGIMVLYVAGRPGVDLEQYVGRQVELFGSIAYRGDLRAHYMTVAQVREVP